MDDLTATALHSMIHKQFESWRASNDYIGEFERGLFQGVTHEDSKDKVYTKMILNSMNIAADISAKIILEILITAGVIKPADERQLRRDILSVVKGQSSVSDMNEDREEK